MPGPSTKTRDVLLPDSQALFGHLPTTGSLGAIGVHESRRALKRARAMLRLLEETGIRPAQVLRRRLARLARSLSPSRDATVAARKARRLAGHVGGDARSALLRVAAISPPARTAAWWDRWRGRLARLRPGLDDLVREPMSLRDIRKALRHSIRRARRQAGRVGRKSDIEKIHEWRKRVVILREQFRIAAPLLGTKAEKRFRQLDRIAGILGDATDFRPVLSAIETLRQPAISAETRRDLKSMIAGEQRSDVAKSRRRWRKIERKLAV